MTIDIGCHFKIEDEEGGSPEGAVTVTIDGEAINEPQTDEDNDGYVSFRVPNGIYEVVDIDAQGYTGTHLTRR